MEKTMGLYAKYLTVILQLNKKCIIEKNSQ